MGLPDSHPEIKPAIFFIVLLYLLIIPCSSRCQTDSTEIILSHEVYFADLEEADSLKFAVEFEYPFVLILTGEEKKDYESLQGIGTKKKYIIDYILRKDRNPLLDVNHWFLEFAGRYEHARDEFGTKVPPYFDDRGEYWIRYGEPWSRFEDSGGSKNMHLFKYYENIMRLFYSAMPIQGFFVKPNESWYYISDKNNFVVHFVKNGRWKKVERLEEALLDRRERNVTWQWMELVKERDALSPEYFAMGEEVRKFEDSFKLIMVTPQGVRVPSEAQSIISGPNPHFLMFTQREDAESSEKSARRRTVPDVDSGYDKINRLDFYSDISQFRGDSGKTAVKTVILQPIEEIRKEWDDDLADTVEISYEYLLRSGDLITQYRSGTKDTVNLSRMLENNVPNIVTINSFIIHPDSLEYTYQLKEGKKDIIGFRQAPLMIRDLSGDELLMSDLMLYYKPPNAGIAEFFPLTEVKDERLSPYPFPEIRPSESLYLYFELYNLNTFYPENSFEIGIDISSTGGKYNIFKKTWNWLRRAKKTDIGVNYKRTVTENDSKELIVLDLGDLRSGEYNLIVIIKDSEGEKIQAESGKVIRISN
ncbi:GWxTD domain-containing protein [candidate division KSB1 bacterium]